MNDINVGKQICEYRNKKNLSIKELAESIGVTSSLLSQIERGLSNPSINTLKLIAKGLDVPIYNFFKENNNSDKLVVKKDDRVKLTFKENNNLSYELLSPSSNGVIQCMLLDLPKNMSTSNELMSHDGEEVATILEGCVELHLDVEIILLNLGDSVRILPNMNHRWVNNFDKDCKIIFSVTPPKF
ncbi:MAG: helix-turn-helix domain-containing protein [Peptostreptococcaceae bacterium]